MIPEDMMQRLIQADTKMKQGIRDICHKDLTPEQEDQELQHLFASYGAEVRGLAVEVMIK